MVENDLVKKAILDRDHTEKIHKEWLEAKTEGAAIKYLLDYTFLEKLSEAEERAKDLGGLGK